MAYVTNVIQMKTHICRLKFEIMLYIFCLKVQQTLHYQKKKEDFWQLFHDSGFKELINPNLNKLLRKWIEGLFKRVESEMSCGWIADVY